MPEAGDIPLYEREGQTGFYRLMDALDGYVRSHDRDLALDAGAAQTDIAMGTAAAGWLAEAVFRSAEPGQTGQPLGVFAIRRNRIAWSFR
jgi:hypothetical protein